MALRFAKADPNKKSEKERIEKESKQQYEEAVGAAFHLLNNEEFSKYRRAYEKLEKLAIEELILIDKTETDPVRYGFRCKDVVSTITHVGNLLRDVRSDAGKRV